MAQRKNQGGGEDLIIEVFDRERSEIFRTPNALWDYPYTLLDACTYSRDQLFRANVFAQRRFDASFARALRGESLWLGREGSWKHELHAVMLEGAEPLASWYTAFLPLLNKRGEVAGVITLRSRGEPRPAGPSSPEPFRPDPWGDLLKSVGAGLAASALYDFLKWLLLSGHLLPDLQEQEIKTFLEGEDRRRSGVG
ncbi:MAG: hypothetical protein KF802_01695 [Bdellovibrionaceae bacterium]|nr:hypothetical protein [Pseudobdellovibrionaceae bacterium]MBX3033970.1 hypothetical protein [Pseudobdellovibrionaceae bacterium]